MNTICLNMIVKNESKIITRLFDSVINIIDTYCICDTGSTDNTIEVIKEYFDNHNIKGKIIEKPFVNFGVNRTYALQQAKHMADYLLFLDADMILVTKPDFDKNKLTYDVYTVSQGSKDFEYYNTRLVSTKLDVKCIGSTHEYYDIPSPNTKSQLNSLFIADIGDGGCKQDKFIRDIKLLENDIKDNPNNPRSYFYLANSYQTIGEHQKAIDTYKKHITIQTWDEEIFYSYYKMGISYKELNDVSNMVSCWLEAYNVKPSRIETIYELIKYYRINSKHHLCSLFYDKVKNTPYPDNDKLFIHKNVYDYDLLIEYSIFASYIGDHDISDVYKKLFNIAPSKYSRMLWSNLKFYNHELKYKNNIDFSNTIVYEGVKYTSSSPCIIPSDDGYMMNVRYVNYGINKNDGSYCNLGKSGIISSINKRIELDKEFNTISETIIDYCQSIKDSSKRYYGIEDIRLYKFKDEIFCHGTAHIDNKLCIYGAEYKDVLQGDKLNYVSSQDVEKNWVIIPHDNENITELNMEMIYKWYPLQVIEKTENHEMRLKIEHKMPNIFSHTRGSTNGFRYNNEIWFVIHFVSYENIRCYYHSIVIFDNDMKLLRYTPPFTFNNEKIEFALGLIVEEDRVIISHSTWDSTTNIKIYDKNYIEVLCK